MSDYLPMNELPRNTRFRHNNTVYVVLVPASEHPDGWVEIVNVDGGGGGFFSKGTVERDVEVLS